MPTLVRTTPRVSAAQESHRTAPIRRGLNVLVALLGLVLAFPVMAVIAVLVKLTSPGPIIYRQPRVGLDRRRSARWPSDGPKRRFDAGGRIFEIYKFRTMTCDQEGSQVWATACDPRITPLGRILRKYRLDELPQLVNVLKGEMNIVGPRPEQPEIFVRLRDEVDGYHRRQVVLPGITGLAQVNRGYDQSLEDVREKVRWDLRYVEESGVLQDIQIMARTLPVMLFRSGAL
jgi:lipopolysaccharide/colanic/teichoic acid biosynthesis glycosyltransferase